MEATVERKTKKTRIARLIVSALLLCLMYSCTDTSSMYCSYRNLQEDGWNRSDTITFSVPCSMIRDSMMLMLRSDNEFPYHRIFLSVNQTAVPSLRTRTDTVRCTIIDKDNRHLGSGLTYYIQKETFAALDTGTDSIVRISVHHIMRRELIYGIKDIGISNQSD